MTADTLCFTGFTREQVLDLQSQLKQTNAQLPAEWTVAPESEARVLIIDMDSLSGHMTWLKAQSGGQITVGVTTGQHSQTDYLLTRPVRTEALKALLGQLQTRQPNVAATSPPAALQPPTASARSETARPSSQTGLGQDAVNPAATSLAHNFHLSDLLAPGTLAGPVSLQFAQAPTLALDPKTQCYAGGSTLKPLLPYIGMHLGPADLRPIDSDRFAALATGHGGTRSFMRLLWLCGLTGGQGRLLPGFSADSDYGLTKWPQTEREFPRHFRLATVMIKGPARLADIAAQAGAGLAETTDFVNANLITGAAVVAGTPPLEPDLARASALLARWHG